MPTISFLDREATKRILESVEGNHSINPAAVEAAAGFYLDAKRRANHSAGRGLKHDIRQIGDQCRQLAGNLESMPLPVALVIPAIRQFLSPDDGHSARLSIDELISELRQIANTSDRFTTLSKGRLVGFDPTMQLTLATLEIAYRHGTGKHATHSSHIDGQHIGEPRSEFGRFVSAFFAEVDPSVMQVSLTTEIRNFVADFDVEQFETPPKKS